MSKTLKGLVLFDLGIGVGATSFPLRFYRIRLGTVSRLDPRTLNRYETEYLVSIKFKKIF